VNAGNGFYLNIVNRSAAPQRVTLFDVVGAYNTQNAAAQNTMYQWDVTTVLLNAASYLQASLLLVAAPVSTGIYQAYTYNNPAGVFTTVEEIVTGLNSMGVGVFSNNGNIVTGYNSMFLLSSISCFNSSLAIANSDITTCINGSLIYDAGYSTGLIGNLAKINPVNLFWINNPASLIAGPYNRSAIISDNFTNDKQNALFYQLQSDVAKTVYIGMAFTDGVNNGGASLYLNNELVWAVTNNAEQNAVAANVNSILGTAYTPAAIMYSLFHIVPVNLVAGSNLIQVDFNAGLALQVYDNTAAEIAAATSEAALTILLNSAGFVGQTLY